VIPSLVTFRAGFTERRDIAWLGLALIPVAERTSDWRSFVGKNARRHRRKVVAEPAFSCECIAPHGRRADSRSLRQCNRARNFQPLFALLAYETRMLTCENVPFMFFCQSSAVEACLAPAQAIFRTTSTCMARDHDETSSFQYAVAQAFAGEDPKSR
jgi:hypothetical protein